MTALDPHTRTVALGDLTQGTDWRLSLAHSRPYHLLIWITRGQGLLLLNGKRRGFGAHNAVYVPADSLFAMDVGRQTLGQAMILPLEVEMHLPEMPRHLRIRDVYVQGELTALMENAAREEREERPLAEDALQAYAALISVWLRRQLLQEDHLPPRRTAAENLSMAYCGLLAENFRSGDTMAGYARLLSVTPTHLARAVKAATGRTAADLLSERLLHEARCLLADTKAPAKDIARHLGFGSAPYFTRFIRQHTGQPPSKLR